MAVVRSHGARKKVGTKKVKVKFETGSNSSSSLEQPRPARPVDVAEETGARDGAAAGVAGFLGSVQRTLKSNLPENVLNAAVAVANPAACPFAALAPSGQKAETAVSPQPLLVEKAFVNSPSTSKNIRKLREMLEEISRLSDCPTFPLGMPEGDGRAALEFRKALAEFKSDLETALQTPWRPEADTLLAFALRADELSKLANTASERALSNVLSSLSWPPVDLDPIAALKKYKNIVIDVRNFGNGNGDIAAGLLTAMDMIVRLRYPAPITLVLNKEGEAVLKAMMATLPSPIERIARERLRFIQDTRLESEVLSPDLYLVPASLNETLSEGRLATKSRGGIFLGKDTSFAVLPVFSKTEGQGVNPSAMLGLSGAEYEMAPPGVSPSESGVYGDYVAAYLRGKPRSEVVQFIKENLPGHTPRHVAASDAIRGILDGTLVRGTTSATVYGVSAETKMQFLSYMKGMADLCKHSNPPRSITLMTPSSVWYLRGRGRSGRHGPSAPSNA